MILGMIGLLTLVGLGNMYYYKSWVYRNPKVLDLTGTKRKLK